MNPVTGNIRITPAISQDLEPGLHRAIVASASMRQKQTRDGRLYTAMKLEFAAPNGGRASLMIPDFIGLIPTAFTALGSQANPDDDLSILELRRLEAEINVVHRRSGDKVYANVASINGISVAK